jgi:hypothetical protein
MKRGRGGKTRGCGGKMRWWKDKRTRTRWKDEEVERGEYKMEERGGGKTRCHSALRLSDRIVMLTVDGPAQGSGLGAEVEFCAILSLKSSRISLRPSISF